MTTNWTVFEFSKGWFVEINGSSVTNTIVDMLSSQVSTHSECTGNISQTVHKLDREERIQLIYATSNDSNSRCCPRSGRSVVHKILAEKFL